MSFTLKDIKDAVVEKKPTDEHIAFFALNKSYNNAIDTQSSVRLRFNREKLAKEIYLKWCDIQVAPKDWDNITEPLKNFILGLADAIIAADKDVIEVEL